VPQRGNHDVPRGIGGDVVLNRALAGRALGGGQSIGLLGGSFDPPHLGHLHLSREALKRFGLDQIVWLVSPGNPLKPNPPAPMSDRMAAARALVTHPRIHISDFEARVGTRYTAETLVALRARYAGVRFVWLMGADNLAQFHKWENWRAILDTVPVGILARPDQRIAARSSPAARLYRDARLPPHAAKALGRADAPAWCFVNIPMTDVSSSAIRAAGKWQRGPKS
jgi:nicotinate-nucleotide adenylyltransferase